MDDDFNAFSFSLLSRVSGRFKLSVLNYADSSRTLFLRFPTATMRHDMNIALLRHG
jgi:hypothetical protein